MIQRITVWDENRVMVGETFPRRAKQLVGKRRASWSDETHTEIVLITEEKGVMELNEKISKSVVKDAYRDSADVVLRSSPLEIIKKSKRRTRELHTAFSLVLWTGVAILYFVINYCLGNRSFTLRPSEISWTWIVFAFAALVECAVEIYFCRKEHDVLNENIDLRQIGPSKDGDLDLHGYQKTLSQKIRMMTSAAIWIPLVIIYFISGYAFNLWSLAWVVFIFGVFFELVRNFASKIKVKAD